MTNLTLIVQRIKSEREKLDSTARFVYEAIDDLDKLLPAER